MILDSREEGSGTKQVYFTELHNNSVTALFSMTGTVTATYLYSPYGETTIHSEESGAATDNQFRYISGWQDTGTDSFYKLGARYYDGHGHFTQQDPLPGSVADPKTMTAYNYGGGDPVNASDPTGQRFCERVPVKTAGTRIYGYRTICADMIKPWAPNACSLSPDSPGFDFAAICNQHDICTRKNGWSFGCDRQFGDSLFRHCNQFAGLTRANCYNVANLYVSAVIANTAMRKIG